MVKSGKYNSGQKSADGFSLKGKAWACLFLCLATYAFGVLLRFWEVPLWMSAEYWIDGEPLLATHDAYAWVAGAKGCGRLFGRPMSDMLAWLHSLTGLNLAVINFWLPLVLAPLVAIPACLLCIYWKIPEGGLVAGVMSVGELGFLLRSRVGFGDTDVLTLFLPLLFAFFLVWWLTPFLHSNWRNFNRKHSAPELRGFSRKRFYFRAFCTGLLFLAYSWFYPNAYPIAMYTLIMLVGVGVFLNRDIPWQDFFAGLAIILAVGKLGLIGLILGAGIFWLGSYRPVVLHSRYLGLGCLIAVLICYPIFHGASVVLKLIEPVLSYAKIDLTRETDSLLKLPTVKQSIREAQNINWSQISVRLAGHWSIFILALAGYVWLAIKRPLALIFLPLLGLSMLSFKLGNRFAMYGGPVLGLGLGYAVSRVMQLISKKSCIRWLGGFAAALLTALPLMNVAADLRPGPIIPKVYARTFMDLARSTPKDAQLWQWWDYGYAAQYYAQRRSFGDGGAHSGPYLFPLAKVHVTDSSAKAAGLMNFIAAHQKKQRLECMDNGTKPGNPGASVLYYPTSPIKPLEDMGPEKARSFLDSLGDNAKVDLPVVPNPQYLVLSWENMRLSYWISFYGTWDLVTGKSFPGRLQRVTSETRLNSEKGVLQFRQGNAIPLTSMDYLAPGGRQHKNWSNSGNIHAVFNAPTKELFLMDETIYNSMMVKMLIGDPDNFNDHFELVVDNFPYNRAYRVK